MKIREHNIATDEIVDRDATPEEIANFEAMAARDKARADAKAAAKSAAEAKLAAIGLTTEDLKALGL